MDFIALSPKIKIPDTSYQIQLGKVSGQWAIRVLNENGVILLSETCPIKKI